MTEPFFTADICDGHADEVEVAAPILRSFGGRERAEGPIRTVQAYGDNSIVREALGETGDGAILIVDGGGARQWAMVGDRLAALAAENGWGGIVVNGCIRDVEQIRKTAIGVWALATNPRKTIKRGQGLRDVTVHFAGVTFISGHYLYADPDGILVAARRLSTRSAP